MIILHRLVFVARNCQPDGCLAGKLSWEPSILAKIYLQFAQTASGDQHAFPSQLSGLICRSRWVTSSIYQRQTYEDTLQKGTINEFIWTSD